LKVNFIHLGRHDVISNTAIGYSEAFRDMMAGRGEGEISVKANWRSPKRRREGSTKEGEREMRNGISGIMRFEEKGQERAISKWFTKLKNPISPTSIFAVSSSSFLSSKHTLFSNRKHLFNNPIPNIFTMSSSTRSASSYGFLYISSWLQLADITRFRTDQGQRREALLAYMNTKATGVFNIQIPPQLERYRELVQQENDDDLPVTMATFLMTLDQDDWYEKVVDVSGTFWPNAQKFRLPTNDSNPDGTPSHQEELHIIIRVDDFRLFW
jgi:hypothetical protein